MFKSLSLALFAFAGVLSGCGNPEVTYTATATAADLGIRSGKLSPDAIGGVCLGDDAAYLVLKDQRQGTDLSDYKPADLAHFTLQSDGAPFSSVQCIPPPPPVVVVPALPSAS